MTFGMSEEQYDISATNITYGKLIEKLIEDFVTRKEMDFIMSSSNLPVNTNVQTLPVPVQVTPANGTGATTAPATGTGTGQTAPVQTGGTVLPQAQITKAKRLREKLTGQTETAATTEAINVASGGNLS